VPRREPPAPRGEPPMPDPGGTSHGSEHTVPPGSEHGSEHALPVPERPPPDKPLRATFGTEDDGIFANTEQSKATSTRPCSPA